MYNLAVLETNNLTLRSIRAGWLNAFHHLGHKATWLPSGKPPLDFFHEQQPEILVLATNELNRALIKACVKYSPKVFLFFEDDQHSSNEEFKFVEELIDAKVLIYPFAFWRDKLAFPWLTWANIGVEPPTITSPGADTIRFKEGKYRTELACDLLYIGSWRSEKARLLRWLESQHDKGAKVRIYGYGEWNHPLHLGVIETDEQYADIVKSATYTWVREGNLDKLFKVELCGGAGIVTCEDGSVPFVGHLSYPEDRTYIKRVTEMLKCLES